MAKNLLEAVRAYLRETPVHEVIAAWDATKHLDGIGPTVDEYLGLEQVYPTPIPPGYQIGNAETCNYDLASPGLFFA